jgi:hypothetical protein
MEPQHSLGDKNICFLKKRGVGKKVTYCPSPELPVHGQENVIII